MKLINLNLSIFSIFRQIRGLQDKQANNGEFPSDRDHYSFTFSTKFGYLSGGDSVDETRSGFYNDIWRINFESLEWFKLDYSLKSGIAFHNMALIDDSILYVFGCEYEHPFLSNTLERFVVLPPSLNRLCLESIMGLPDVKTITECLPASIADELNTNTTE
ncbi:hypothetical protein RF11_05096 [Thelohanellus kitauei]|uniref:Kelch domain-containing protein 10 n=1 Tax=Thelohanellus kitauei TaxID=669202 RepID=A0A0C2MHP6_THEKT|nr:hypothetical protein RF11_05096 [Thelohanellus kitauei]